jgi:hypothetical protein
VRATEVTGKPSRRGAVGPVQEPDAVQGDAGVPLAASSVRSDMDRAAWTSEVPNGRGVEMAQQRPWATGEDRGRPAAALGKARVADGIHAAVDAVEAAVI